MKLSEYFNQADGFGVLSTADQSGKVNAAVYSRPHFMDEETIAFIAGDRLTRANLLKNPHAVYLFREEGSYEGRRLYITRLREEKDSPLIDEIRRKKHPVKKEKPENGTRYLIFFHLDKVLPLIGDGKV
jgi:hypothetical protein